MSNVASVRIVLFRSVVWVAWDSTRLKYKNATMAHLSSSTSISTLVFESFQKNKNRTNHISDMHFSTALLVLASVFIVGSNALNMFVFHLLLPSSESTACTPFSHSHFEQFHSFWCQELIATDPVRPYQRLQVAMEGPIAQPTRRLLLQSARPAAATHAWHPFRTRATTTLFVNATWVNQDMITKRVTGWLLIGK